MVFYIKNCWINSWSVYPNSCLIICCYMKILKQGPSYLQRHVVIVSGRCVRHLRGVFSGSVLFDLIGSFCRVGTCHETICEARFLTSALERIHGFTFNDCKPLITVTFQLTLLNAYFIAKSLCLAVYFHLFFTLLKSTIN